MKGPSWERWQAHYPTIIYNLCDLPDYILRLVRQILENTAHSSDGRPDLS